MNQAGAAKLAELCKQDTHFKVNMLGVLRVGLKSVWVGWVEQAQQGSQAGGVWAGWVKHVGVEQGESMRYLGVTAMVPSQVEPFLAREIGE